MTDTADTVHDRVAWSDTSVLDAVFAMHPDALGSCGATRTGDPGSPWVTSGGPPAPCAVGPTALRDRAVARVHPGALARRRLRQAASDVLPARHLSRCG